MVSYGFFFLLSGRRKGLGCRGGEEQGLGGQSGMGQSGRPIGPLQRREGSLNLDVQSGERSGSLVPRQLKEMIYFLTQRYGLFARE